VTSFPKVSELRAADLQAHLAPNVLGVLWLYQAALPLLRASDSSRWVTMGSMAGSIAVSFDICPFLRLILMVKASDEGQERRFRKKKKKKKKKSPRKPC
jgi:hypothetical protein